MRDKRGQLTLFVIIAVVIIAIVLLVIFLVPKTNNPQNTASESIDPETYISSCINDELEPMVDDIAVRGGDFEKNNCIFYGDICRKYLCYQTLPYRPCVNQEPLLQQHIEGLIKERLQEEDVVDACVDNFINAAQRKGYETSVCNSPQFSVVLIPGQVTVPINCQMTLAKGEENKKFMNLNTSMSWPLFDFIMISQKIIDDEMRKTDFDPFSFMLSNTLIEIEKIRTSDGSDIYVLRDRATRKEFVFALKNYILPRGPL